MQRIVTIFIIIFVLFLPISTIFAQSLNGEPAITLSLNPPDPEPGEGVTATLVSYETNLNLAYIVWQHGNDTKSGYGETKFSTKITSDETKSDFISASITLSDGQIIEKQITVAPTSFDITWEATNSIYPPFFMGKRMPIRENSIRIAVINPKKTGPVLAYTWNRNGSAITNTGGSSKPYIDIINTEINNKESINVSIVSNNSVAERGVVIPFKKPKILFYEYNPLTGLNIGNTINDKVMGYEKIASIFIVPIGINVNSKNIFSWVLSGTPVNNQENPRLLSFNFPNTNGKVTVSVNVENLRSIYQEVKGGLELIF